MYLCRKRLSKQCKTQKNPHTNGESLKYIRAPLNLINKHKYTKWYLFIQIRQISVTLKFQKQEHKENEHLKRKICTIICLSCYWLLILVDNGNLSLPVIKIVMYRL